MLEKWQEGLLPLIGVAAVLAAGGISGLLLTGLVVFVLELLNIGNPDDMESLLGVGAAIGAMGFGPVFYADHLRNEAQPKAIDNLSEPMVLALLPLERLWQHQADLMRDLGRTNIALANRIGGIDDDLARRFAAHLRERADELESERKTTQEFIDGWK